MKIILYAVFEVKFWCLTSMKRISFLFYLYEYLLLAHIRKLTLKYFEKSTWKLFLLIKMSSSKFYTWINELVLFSQMFFIPAILCYFVVFNIFLNVIISFKLDVSKISCNMNFAHHFTFPFNHWSVREHWNTQYCKYK